MSFLTTIKLITRGYDQSYGVYENRTFPRTTYLVWIITRKTQDSMDETNIVSNYARPITYFGVAYTLTKEDNNRLGGIDKLVQERLKDSIYFAPDGSRHITIMNITFVAEGYQDSSIMRFFQDSAELYKDRLKTIASNFKPFEVRFTHLQAGTGAIILRGQDEGQIGALRNELIDLPRLNGRLIDSGFIHSTQARYKRQVPIKEVRDRLEDIEVDIPITIDKIGLVRADVSFSEPHVVLEEFRLG